MRFSTTSETTMSRGASAVGSADAGAHRPVVDRTPSTADLAHDGFEQSETNPSVVKRAMDSVDYYEMSMATSLLTGVLFLTSLAPLAPVVAGVGVGFMLAKLSMD